MKTLFSATREAVRRTLGSKRTLSQPPAEPTFREVANQFDTTATKLDTLRRRDQSQLLSIALRQPIPTEQQCGHCKEEAHIVQNCESAMAIACAAALIVPLLAPACEGATILYLAAVSNYWICVLYLQLCKAYYGN